MSSSFQFSSPARATAVQALREAAGTDRKGRRADFAPLYEDRWLVDTAVIERLTRIRGEWRVELVFASIHDPLRLIKRHITSHPTAERAAQQAHYMRRLAAKDQRGTLAISVQQLAPCLN